jgi:predicted GNAT family N-acyltransferase
MKTEALIELLPWEKARAHASPIRFAVFVEEQGVPRDIELDEHDAVSVHAVAFEGGKAVATGRLLPDGHIGRMAVLKEWRGRGIGASLLAKLMELASRRGHGEVVLSAQVHAVPFYRAHGFIPEGGEYQEAGIRHQAMRRRL